MREKCLKWDGHTHTPFCYHGSSIAQEKYVEQAIKLGFERYTLSEHAPLPLKWIDDNSLFKRLAMPYSELSLYIEHAKRYKQQYNGKIEVTVGLELDYLPGKLDFTAKIIDEYDQDLEDIIYSVHYIPGKGGMKLIDYRPDYFKEHILTYYGTMENVVDEYYNQIEEAIEWISPFSKRKRIGHIHLIEKFKKVLPEIDEGQIKARLERIVPLLHKMNVGLDVNTAGLRVDTCGEAYVPEWFLLKCRQQGIPCVYGSDAHAPEHIGTGWDWFLEYESMSF